jgi:competence CoiA-like predicted nuclease
MLYALVNGIKSTASKESKGICPFCETEMTPKCGEFVSWHWAHKKMDSCDPWNKPETEWHRNWKKVFGTHNCEIILKKENQKHIADIKTIHDRIIELQNSPINIETLNSREEFYGNDMIWIINGIKFIDNFIFKPFHYLEYDTYSPDFDKYAKMHGFTPHYKSTIEEIKERFEWKRPKGVWSYSKANIYIDFGDEYLFNIKEGVGFAKGVGIKILKQQFIIENGGNQSLVPILIIK